MMRNALVMLNQLPLHDLSQASLLIHLHQDEVENWQALLKLMPQSIVDLILTLRTNESTLIKRLLCDKTIKDISIDEIFLLLITAMPNDTDLVNYESQAKLAYLSEMLTRAWDFDDNMYREIMAPIDKIASLMLVKREELDGTMQMRQQMEKKTNQDVKAFETELNTVRCNQAEQLAAQVQQVSITLLEDMRCKLLQATQQYKNELETLLIQYLESVNVEAAKRAMLTSPMFTNDRILLGKRGIEYLANDVTPISQYLTSFLTKPKAKKAIADYRIISQLHDSIQKPIRDKTQGLQQIGNFKMLFDSHLKSLQDNSRGLNFVRVILSILTFGLANHLIWRKTSNENFADKVKSDLFYNPSPKKPIEERLCGFSCFRP